MSCETDKHFQNDVINLIVLGSGGVGKSAITVRYVSHHFIQFYDPTIEDSYRTLKTINGQEYQINITDTAGQEEYSALRDMYIRQSEGFILVFSLISPTSLTDLYLFKDSIYRILDYEPSIDNLNTNDSNYIPILLCGNKKDLISERKINPEEIKRISDDWKCLYREVSAKTSDGIDEMFHDFLKEIIRVRDLKQNLKNIEHKINENKNNKIIPKQNKKYYKCVSL